jgi:hypothetical protein
MKIRCGLVSNSSSSSFIIATRGELSRDKLKSVIEQALKVPTDSPLYYLVDEFAGILSYGTPYTLEELLDEMGYDKPGDAFRRNPVLAKAVKNGFASFYYGSVGNEDGGAEEMLCNLGIQYEDDDILIDKEDGY